MHNAESKLGSHEHTTCTFKNSVRFLSLQFSFLCDAKVKSRAALKAQVLSSGKGRERACTILMVVDNLGLPNQCYLHWHPVFSDNEVIYWGN